MEHTHTKRFGYACLQYAYAELYYNTYYTAAAQNWFAFHKNLHYACLPTNNLDTHFLFKLKQQDFCKPLTLYLLKFSMYKSKHMMHFKCYFLNIT